jgi:ribosomal protein S18 acetylase RimI-like enzyme
MFATMRAYFGALAEASPGGHVVELPGVAGCVVPRLPERSVFNCVIYDDAGALEQGLDRLAEAYDSAGVNAWTVWVHESDTRAQEVLAGAGHELDAKPAAMACELASLERPATAEELEIDDEPSIEDAVEVLEASYRWPLRAGFPRWSDGTRPYLARLDGRPATVLAIQENAGDAGLFMVGTIPEARGRGIARALVSEALRASRDRGCDISTLQATPMGEPVYAQLGYRPHGRVHMWERRRPGPAG